MTVNDLNLDDEAERLYRELGGIDTEYSEKAAQSAGVKADEKRSDVWRLVMVETVHRLAPYLNGKALGQEEDGSSGTFAKLMECIEKLSEIPGNDGCFLVRFRGFPTGTDISAKNDYIIILGRLKVDAAQMGAINERMGAATQSVEALDRTCRIFSRFGIHNLFLPIPARNEMADARAVQLMRESLSIISQYQAALQGGNDITFSIKGETVHLPIVKNEAGDPDINLTLLAGINRVNPQTMTAYVRQVADLLKKMEKKGGTPYTGIYDAMLNVKPLRDQLSRPSVEINNMKWLSMDFGFGEMSKKKALVSRAVMQNYRENPHNMAQMMHCVYGDDYRQISAGHFSRRLTLSSHLLSSFDRRPEQKDARKEVVRNLRARFGEVQDEVYDNLIVQENLLKLREAHKETVIGRIHAAIAKLLGFYKGRAAAHRKMQNIARKGINFTARDYKTIAADFNISIEDAIRLVGMLKSCFDDQGRFLRASFEAHIPEFAGFEKKVYRFLWYYLKETPTRNDRVAFLNSLQLLIARMKQAVDIIKILLWDIIGSPETVNVSDRNAFMLSSLLVRSYNKELNVDIEVTPEEVLLVQNGLDREIISEVVRFIESEQDAFSSKMEAIYRTLIQSLAAEGADRRFIPVRSMLQLEREALIFLSLVGGEVARDTLRNAVDRFGSPGTDIYQNHQIRPYIGLMLQHLIVAVRGLERMAENEDLIFFERVLESERLFLTFSNDQRYQDIVKRLMSWVQAAKNKIVKRIEKERTQPADPHVPPKKTGRPEGGKKSSHLKVL